MAAAVQRIAVLGAGAWGTALALAAARAGRQVTLWCRRPEQAAALADSRENAAYLPGVTLPESVTITSEAADLAAAEATILAVPAQRLRGVLQALEPRLSPGPVLIAAKGIELESGRLLDAVVAETLPGRPVAALSGPTFAAEVAAGLPAAVTLAIDEEARGAALVQALGSATFRPYWSGDLTGALVGGAVKNVVAIACGIVEGRGLGENARAALVTRGLAEIGRLGAALGARRETLMGLSGLGDLVLTATSPQSRNYALGRRIGAGETLAAAQGHSRGVSEGVATAAAVVRLAAARSVEMPIAEAVEAVLHRGADIDTAVAGLLARPFKPETH